MHIRAGGCLSNTMQSRTVNMIINFTSLRMYRARANARARGR